MPDKPTAAEASEHTLQLVLPDMADDTEFCMYCSRCFQECTETLLAEQLLQARLAADVNKRIGIFEKSWNSGKLSPNAKPTVGHLARALELKEYKLADKIHMKLVTDHISEVSQWIVGIKKLIQAGCSPS
ncbi:steroid receptor RNA activator 1-like isoform X2 [Watersipora subatra]